MPEVICHITGFGDKGVELSAFLDKPPITNYGNGIVRRIEDGTESWYKDGKLHRDGDKPAIIRCDGTQEWWVNDKRTRVVKS